MLTGTPASGLPTHRNASFGGNDNNDWVSLLSLTKVHTYPAKNRNSSEIFKQQTEELHKKFVKNQECPKSIEEHKKKVDHPSITHMWKKDKCVTKDVAECKEAYSKKECVYCNFPDTSAVDEEGEKLMIGRCIKYHGTAAVAKDAKAAPAAAPDAATLKAKANKDELDTAQKQFDDAKKAANANKDDTAAAAKLVKAEKELKAVKDKQDKQADKGFGFKSAIKHKHPPGYNLFELQLAACKDEADCDCVLRQIRGESENGEPIQCAVDTHARYVNRPTLFLLSLSSHPS